MPPSPSLPPSHPSPLPPVDSPSQDLLEFKLPGGIPGREPRVRLLAVLAQYAGSIGERGGGAGSEKAGGKERGAGGERIWAVCGDWVGGAG